ncbi:MAG: PAC2 family protein [candidate division WOR-3 bacterium]
MSGNNRNNDASPANSKAAEPAPVKAPVLFACWPGMGHVGILAAEYMRVILNGQMLTELDVAPYFLPDAITVENGIGRIPDPPAQRLYYIPNPPFFIFEGETQLSGEPGIRIGLELLKLAKRHGVTTVYTGAAYAMPMSHRQTPKVYGVATDERLKNTFADLGVEPLEEGRISGLNGLLLGLARARGLSAACFLATMPQYAVETPNPKASKAIIKVLERILGANVDMTELDRRIHEADQFMGEFESRVAAAIESLRRETENKLREHKPEQEEETESEERPEPHELMAHIEELFEEVQHDRSKAALLKQELDRWGLFELYEDRFLDLFTRDRNR